MSNIVQEVADLARAAGFQVLDMGAWGMEVHGPLDSIAILVDTLLEKQAETPRRYRKRRIKTATTKGTP